jgi:carboxyl-terminal processing protease
MNPRLLPQFDSSRVRRWLTTTGLALVLSVSGASQAETNYGDVGMYVAKALADRHYSRHDFDAEYSKRTLLHFLNTLDGEHKFLLQSDIDQFKAEYENTLDKLTLIGDISPAHKMYAVFEKRVKDRVARIGQMLEKEKFTFDSKQSIEITRHKLGWPKDEAEADDLWRREITNELLAEKLNVRYKDEKAKEKAAKAKDKPVDPAAEAKAKELEAKKKAAPPLDPPDVRIRKRYEKFVESLQENDEEERANFFLSALTLAYDPHSEYMSQSEWENFMIQMTNKLIGIGALLQKKEEGVAIQGIIVGGPADKSGLLKEGDKIVGVAQGEDGKMDDVRYQKLQKIVEKIRGEKDSTVRLQVIPGDDPGGLKEISIAREEVPLKDKISQAQIIDEKVGEVTNRLGWITLPSFYADMEDHKTSCADDVRRLLQRLVEEKVTGVVLDLRGNGGGSLEEAINLTGLFIPRGPVVQVVDWRREAADRKNTPNSEPMYKGPLVVLCDKTSASASEIVAAAFQDYNRALVVGDSSTFGKGTVQTILNMQRVMPFFSDSKRAGALKVTIQKFYRIAGGSTQLKGVVSDLVIPSRVDGYEVGEDELENPLEYDTIKPLRYSTTSAGFPVEELRSRSKVRVEKESEFTLLAEDIKRTQENIKKNSISLNEEDRWAEVQTNKERRNARNESRKARIAAFTQAEKDRFKVYRLTLDNVEDKDLKLDADFTDEQSTGMRMAKDDDDEIDDKIKFPWDLEPGKLEALHILQDLIALTDPNHTALATPPATDTSAK